MKSKYVFIIATRYPNPAKICARVKRKEAKELGATFFESREECENQIYKDSSSILIF